MKIHFISIGGSVMHQLAIALQRKGYEVSGSDDEIFEPARTNLKAAGLFPDPIGWNVENIHPKLDAVILGMHAKADNPELLKAQQYGLKIYSFPEYIYQQSLDKIRVVIGGSHGKTTTTSMVMHVLKEREKEFDYLVGARLEGFDQSVQITDAPVIICEGDEYPASIIEKRPKFHFLYPDIAVLTGIAWDHINVFPTFENYVDQFRIFIGKIKKDGILIFNESDKVLADLIESTRRNDIRYQPYIIPEHFIKDGQTYLQLGAKEFSLKVFGDHNLLNLNAAYFVCKQLGVTEEDFGNAISSFSGASRRLELMASNNCTSIYRDFAHAPSKVKATIEAVKHQFSDRNLIAILELHTYSSLNENFMNEFSGSMDQADSAVVFFSKHALELKRMPPLSKQKIMDGFNKKNLQVFTEKEELQHWLDQQDFFRTNLLLMSSGNYDGLDMFAFAKQITAH